MDYKTMWKELHNHLENSQEIYNATKVPHLKIKAEQSGAIRTFMKVIEQEHLYKNVRKENVK
jgi:hypothetical protein